MKIKMNKNINNIKNIKKEVYFPLYHEDKCIERDKIREDILNRYWNESIEYSNAMKNWIEWNKLPHNKKWKYIVLNWNIVWIGDEIEFNLRFGEKATGKIIEIKTYWFQWEYSLIVATPQIVKNNYEYYETYLEVTKGYSPSANNGAISYSKYIDYIVDFENPYKYMEVYNKY